MLEQQTRTCSDKQKEAAESSVRPFENLCFCVSEEVTVPKKKKKLGWVERVGAVRKPTT